MGVDIYATHPVKSVEEEMCQKLTTELGFKNLRGFVTVGRKVLWDTNGTCTDVTNGESVDADWVTPFRRTTGCDFEELRIHQITTPDTLWKWLVHGLRRQRDIGLTESESKVLHFLEIIADYDGELCVW